VKSLNGCHEELSHTTIKVYAKSLLTRTMGVHTRPTVATKPAGEVNLRNNPPTNKTLRTLNNNTNNLMTWNQGALKKPIRPSVESLISPTNTRKLTPNQNPTPKRPGDRDIADLNPPITMEKNSLQDKTPRYTVTSRLK
jgi:hypothetical protein